MPDGSLPPGTVISYTYRIVELVARGGMGEVYRAVHEVQGTEHAIKTILPALARDEKMVALFKREASNVREIRHDALVSYDGVIRDGEGRLYIVTDFVHGPSLAERLTRQPLTPVEIEILCRRLASGLAAAHAKGIVHRDVSPDNVILAGGAIERAMLIDFGIARDVSGRTHTVIGSDFAGKYAYASPEQIGLHGGNVDARSDIYSLGLVLAAAAGKPVDMGKTQAAVLQVRESVPDLSSLPPGLRALLQWMLQPDPADRPQSMAALLASDELRDLAGGDNVTRKHARPPAAAGKGRPDGGKPEAEPASGRPDGGRIAPRTWRIPALAAVLLLAGAGAVGTYLLGGGRSPVEAPSPSADRSPPSSGPSSGAGPTAGQPSSPPGAGSAARATPNPDLPAGSMTAREIIDTLRAFAERSSSDEEEVPNEPVPFESGRAEPGPAGSGLAEAGSTRPDARVASLRDDQPRNRLQVLRERIATLPCARVTVREENSRVVLAGFVSRESDRAGLQALSVGPAEIGIRDLAVYEPPFCAALLALAPFREGAEVLPLRLDRVDAVYRGGQGMTIQVGTPASQSGYLTVDFIDPAGQVTFLKPSSLYDGAPVKPGRTVVLGGRGADGQPLLSLGEPYGRQMIVAVWSKQPLFDTDRGDGLDAEAYLRQLSSRLRAVSGDRPGEVRVAVQFLTAQP